MKVKLLTCVSTMDNVGIHKLKHSLDFFNYDYEIIVDPTIEWSWAGWHKFYKWCKEQEATEDGYTHFIYTDGFDTLALAPMQEIIDKYVKIDPECFLYSTEKACYPIVEWDKEYPQVEEHQRWRYVNGGQFMSSVKKFIEMYEQIDLNVNSQQWGAWKYIWDNEDKKVKLDINCEVFQSVAFIAGDDFGILDHDKPKGERRLYNYHTKSTGVLAHGNGHAPMQFVYDIMDL